MSGRRPTLLLALTLLLGCSAELELELLGIESDAAAEGGADSVADDARADTAVSDATRPVERDAGGEPDGDASDDERSDGGRGPSRNALVLRYDFAGRGQEVLDRVGTRHGRIIGTSQLDGSGKLALNGTDSYVDLPARIISRLENATIVAWFEYRASEANTCWHRLFDFGSNTIRDGRMQSVTSLFFTPRVCWDRPVENPSALYVELTTPTGMRTGAPLPGDIVRPFMPRMLAITFAVDARSIVVRSHFEGVERASGRYEFRTGYEFRLSNIDDVNNWLGRSQWDQDRLAPITYDEFRIYDRVLGSQEIEQLFRQGPDAP